MEDYIITAPSVIANDNLFNLFKSLPGNGAKNRDDFYAFLTTPCEERRLFLLAHCDYVIDAIGNVLIHKLTAK